MFVTGRRRQMMGRQGAQRVPWRGRVGWRPEGRRICVAPRGQQRGRRTVQETGELEISDLNRRNGPLPTNDTWWGHGCLPFTPRPERKRPTAFDSLLVFLRSHSSSGLARARRPPQPTDISAQRLQAVEARPLGVTAPSVTRCGLTSSSDGPQQGPSLAEVGKQTIGSFPAES